MRKNSIIWILFLVFTLFVSAGNTINQKIEKLENKLKTVSENEKIDVLNQLAVELYNTSTEEGFNRAKQAFDLAKRLKDGRGEAIALRNIAIGYRYMGELGKAEEHIQKALKIFKKIGDRKNISGSLKDIGILYYFKGQYDTALEYYFSSLKIAEEIGDKSGISNIINNIGIIYFCLKKGEKALEYYQRSLEIEKELGNKKGIATSFENIAMAYSNLKNENKALEYYQKALKMSEEIGDQSGIATNMMHLGILYDAKKDYQKSVKYLSTSLELSEKSGWKDIAATVASNLGLSYLNQKKYHQALLHLHKSLRLGKEIKNHMVIESGYKNLSELYTQKGDYKKAFKYYKSYFETFKNSFNENVSRQITEMQTKYDTLKKEKENQVLKRDIKIQKITRNALIVGFILVLIILILLFKRYLYLFAFWKRQKYIGQFRLQEPIGSGGMSTVYKAHHIRDKTETVAVKVLREDLFPDENMKKRFKQEATIIDKLDHPNIVKVIERGEDRGKLFIVMEWLGGKTLDVKIEKEGSIDLKACFHIMTQILDAIVLIHSKEIIHRDLKPSNIMLIDTPGDKNLVKLLDFGVAKMKFQTRLTKSGMLVGTIHYMSPEQISRSEFSQAGDIFSLGVTFYEMATGKKPFTGEGESVVIKEILGKNPDEPAFLRPEIPDSMNRLLMDMLKKEPSHRPSSEAVLNIIKKFW